MTTGPCWFPACVATPQDVKIEIKLHQMTVFILALCTELLSQGIPQVTSLSLVALDPQRQGRKTLRICLEKVCHYGIRLIAHRLFKISDKTRSTRHNPTTRKKQGSERLAEE